MWVDCKCIHEQIGTLFKLPPFFHGDSTWSSFVDHSLSEWTMALHWVDSDTPTKIEGIYSIPIIGSSIFSVSPFLVYRKESKGTMNPLLLGTLIFVVLGTVSTIVVYLLYKTKKMSRTAAEYRLHSCASCVEQAWLFAFLALYVCGWFGFAYTWCRWGVFVGLRYLLDEPSACSYQEWSFWELRFFFISNWFLN